MKILILGGTGSIGSAVTAELVTQGHEVTGLARSVTSAQKLMDLGANPHSGDLRTPRSWAAPLAQAEAVIQLATTFDTDMAEVDAAAMDAIRAEARSRTQPLRLIYTGGCWLYGQTGDRTASEVSPKRPILAFAWMQDTAEVLLADTHLSCCVIHPAMVYHEEGGGVFSRLLQQASRDIPFEIWGSLNTRWPLVHRGDLARAYRLLLEQTDLTGNFNVVAQSGVPVRDIVNEIIRRHDHSGTYVVRSRKHVMFKYGAWAEGPTLDQQMSANKIQQSCNWQPQVSDFTQAAF